MYNNDKELNFIDRDTFCTQIDSAYKHIISDSTYFKIICFHGMGGIGKSRLVKENLKNMCVSSAKPLSINLEITRRDDLLDILIKFRKALPRKYFYPLFDYAMLLLWNNLNVSQLNEEFLSFTKSNVTEYLKTILDVGIGIKTGMPIASIIDLFFKSYNKIKDLYNNHLLNKILNDINNMQTYELLNNLPILLGIDIHKAFLNKPLILVIDAFKNYSPNISDTNSWLISLITNINYGLFIVTSREEIMWPNELKKYVDSRDMTKLPVDEVREELLKEFREYPKLVNNIIETTDCIPIYLDLAVNASLTIGKKTLSQNKFFFKNKEDIIHQFLAHLKEDEQEVIIVLSIVQIFDQQIFEHLVYDLHLQISYLKFETIRNRSLIRNVENDNYFFKTHDIVSDNISAITSKYEKKRILKSYLTYIHMRVNNLYSDIQTNMLFKHILTLYIKNDIALSEPDNEKLLDIFFTIKESGIPFDCNEINHFEQCNNLRDIFFFVKALSKERESSNIRLQWLNKINEDICQFGKHIKSLQLMKGYLRALCEGTQYLKEAVNTINTALTENEMNEWYYGQTKIFLGDCCISYGKFNTGIRELNVYRNLLPQLIGKENHSFQVIRHIAHGYRFNMMLDEAENLYRGLIYGEDVFPNPLQKVYILTNLCETYCYFNPEKVLSIQREALELSNKFNDLKSKGKIYYSLAIVWLINKKYKRARKCIHKSLRFNQQDGYLAGKLYAHMTQAYYEYSLTHTISDNTLHIIQHIQEKIEVYSCFYLPIALMCEDYYKLPQIRNSQEWIDYDYTAVKYRCFLDALIN